MGKRILVFFLIMVLVISPVSVNAAATGSVVVAGGAIATGGLAAGSALTESTAITLIMSFLFSMGVTVHLTQEAINSGQSAYSYVKSLFSEWVSGTSPEQMSSSDREELARRFSVINGGGHIDPTGNIFLNGTALDLFRRFVNWCKQTGKIGDSSSSGGDYQSGTINGISTIYSSELRDDTTNVWYCTAGSLYNSGQSVSVITDPVNVLWYRFYTTSSVYRVAVSTLGNDVYLYSCSGENIVDGYKLIRYGSTNYTYNLYSANRRYANLYPDATFINDESFTGQSGAVLKPFFTGGDGTLGVEGSGSGSSLPDGLVHDGDVDTSVLDNPDNNQTVINPGLLPTIADDNPGKEYQVSADDYLEAIRQILNQKTNPADVPEQLPVTDVPTGVTVPVDIPADQPANWPITTPSSPTATPDVPTGSTPVVDPATPADPETAMPKLTFPLDEYFPFCIPFDVYALLSKFSADPVTPVFDVGFTEPFTNSEVNLHIDLAPWNGVATAVRTAELGAFIVGLALLSKQIFTRG